MSRNAITAPDGRAVAHHRRGGVRDRDRAAVLAPEPGVVLPDRAPGAHGLAGRGEQEVRGGACSVTVADRVVDGMSSDGSSTMSAAAAVDEDQLPGRVDGADALADVEGDRGEPLALDVHLLVQLGVAQRAGADGGQRPQQAAVGRRQTARPGVGPRRPATAGWPATASAPPARPRRGRPRPVGLRAAQQLAGGVEDGVDHRLLPQAAVGLQGDLEQPFHPGPVIQGAEPGGNEPALQDHDRDGQGHAPTRGPGSPGPGSRRPARRPRPAMTWIGRSVAELRSSPRPSRP